MRAGVLDGHVAHAGQPIRADLLPLHRDLVNPTFRVPRALPEYHEHCQSTTSTARVPRVLLEHQRCSGIVTLQGDAVPRVVEAAAEHSRQAMGRR
jgi:hypothetical protein